MKVSVRFDALAAPLGLPSLIPGWLIPGLLIACLLILVLTGCQRQPDATLSAPPASQSGSSPRAASSLATDLEPSDRQQLDSENDPPGMADPAMSAGQRSTSHTDGTADVHDGNVSSNANDRRDDSSSVTSTSELVTDAANDVSVGEAGDNEQPASNPYPFRLLLPTTAGTLLVDLDVLVEGEPLAEVFERQIARILESAAGDDAATWNGLLDYLGKHPQRFGNSPINPQQYRDFIRMYERNRNGRPDPDEVASLIFRDTGFSGPFRLIGTNAFRQVNRRQSPLFIAIDQDNDGVLSEREIIHATDSLQKLDRNGDRRLDFTEANPQSDNRVVDEAWNNRRVSRWGDVAMDLAGFVDWSMVAYSIDAASPTAVFRNGPSVVLMLDLDGDDVVSEDEARRLLEIQADLRVKLHFQNRVASRPRLTIELPDASPDVAIDASSTNDRVTVQSSRFQLITTVADRLTVGNPISPERLDQLDANRNGGLDEDEIAGLLPGNQSFSELDQDKDGKLTREELMEGMLIDAPTWTVQVRARGAEAPDAVFMWLDQDQDGMLSTRELSRCAERLKGLASKQMTVEANDFPDTYLLQFGRGEPQQDSQLFAWKPTAAEDSGRPRWARSMDINQDGDIGRDEFLGLPSMFDHLDRDQDGFLDPEEIQSISGDEPGF